MNLKYFIVFVLFCSDECGGLIIVWCLFRLVGSIFHVLL